MRQRLVVGSGRQRVPSAGAGANRLIPAQHQMNKAARDIMTANPGLGQTAAWAKPVVATALEFTPEP
jgi:hypothetical protein